MNAVNTSAVAAVPLLIEFCALPITAMGAAELSITAEPVKPSMFAPLLGVQVVMLFLPTGDKCVRTSVVFLCHQVFLYRTVLFVGTVRLRSGRRRRCPARTFGTSRSPGIHVVATLDRASPQSWLPQGD